MPFARPHFAKILSAIDVALNNDYPARGEARSTATPARNLIAVPIKTKPFAFVCIALPREIHLL